MKIGEWGWSASGKDSEIRYYYNFMRYQIIIYNITNEWENIWQLMKDIPLRWHCRAKNARVITYIQPQLSSKVAKLSSSDNWNQITPWWSGWALHKTMGSNPCLAILFTIEFVFRSLGIKALVAYWDRLSTDGETHITMKLISGPLLTFNSHCNSVNHFPVYTLGSSSLFTGS